MTHSFTSTETRNLCGPCAVEVAQENTVERQAVDVRLLLQQRQHGAAVLDVVRRLVEAGSPGSVPHVLVTRRRILPARREPQGVSGFPIGRIRYRFQDPEPLADAAVMTDEAEALVLTDGRIVRVGGGVLDHVDQSVVRERIQQHARRHGVPVD